MSGLVRRKTTRSSNRLFDGVRMIRPPLMRPCPRGASGLISSGGCERTEGCDMEV
jgi:hypothetical protein